MGRIFCIRSYPSLIACYRHEYGQYILVVWKVCRHMYLNSQQNQYNMVINGIGRKLTQNYFNRWIKGWKGEKHNNQLKHCDIEHYFPRSKSLSLNLSWKTHDNNIHLCSYQSMCINITLSFCSIFFIVFPTAVSSVHPG